MRTYTKLSALAAAFLISSVQADAQSIPTINDALKGFDKVAEPLETEEILLDSEINYQSETPTVSPSVSEPAVEAVKTVESLPTEVTETLPPISEPAVEAVKTAPVDDSYNTVAPTEVTETLPPISEPAVKTVEIVPADGSYNTVTSNIVQPDIESSYSIELPNNGLIYAIQDPYIGGAVLNIVTLPYVSFVDGAISEPVIFYVRSNYFAFIDRMEVNIYKGSDKDMVEPLATIPVKPTPFGIFSWDGKLSNEHSYSVGDELIYVLKAYDKDGRFDETSYGKIELLRPEDVNSNKDGLRELTSKDQGEQLSSDEAVTQYLLNEVFFSNALYRQNIVVYGSKIVLRGVNIPEGTAVFINNSNYPVDLERKFVAEYIMPEGVHYYDIALRGKHSLSEKLKVEVLPYYFFGVAIADFTVRKTEVSGYSSGNENDLLKDGRLAFYLKGKAYSKYNITAQADTTQKDIKKLFNGFTQAEPTDLFQSLDPDMYYPTYGDDSTTFKDINTQGRFYVRVDWDKSQALWGNYNTDFSGTNYASYSRSFYGAKLDYRSIGTNDWGDALTTVKAFGSEAKSAAGHSEFLGTGGSLYYLKNTDIIPGSDKIVLQVTDKSTGNIVAKINLLRGADYEIDSLQGRVILSRPLSQIIYQNVHSITSTTPVSGYEQRLIADYEFVPTSFDDDYITAGIRAKQWIGNYIAVGGTYVKEKQGDKDDYEIAGADLTLQTGKGTYVKAEYTQTKARPEFASIFYSDNGGLSFASLGTESNTTSANAIAVDGRVNFKELGLSKNELSAGAWWRDVGEGFSSTTSSSTTTGITEYGAELAGEVNKDISLYTKFSRAQQGEDDSYTEAQITAKYRLLDELHVSAEILHAQSKTSVEDESSKGTIGALRVDYNLLENLETFLTGQFTLDDDNGKYENNDAVIVGARYLYGDSTIGARYTAGHRGEAAQVDLSHHLSKDHTIYGGYTWSNDYASDFDSVFGNAKNTGLTVGQRWNITNRVTLFNESQYLTNQGDKGSTDSLGMDFFLGEGWNLGFIYQKGRLDSANDGDLDRDSFSVSVGKTSSIMNWLSKLEYRQDVGSEEREQWVTTNRLSYKVDDSLRLASRINYSKTKDHLNTQNGARFTEANLGFSYRPFNSNKWAFFGKYTYLYDLASLGQDIVNGSAYDQNTQIASLEGVYKMDDKWELALKYANRIGKARYGRGDGDWYNSATTFYAGQLRYDIMYKWHGLLEYRILAVKDGGTKQGYMLGVDRDLTDNFRVGVGYNFTDFSDDLTKLDYKYRGWFINVVGTY